MTRSRIPAVLPTLTGIVHPAMLLICLPMLAFGI